MTNMTFNLAVWFAQSFSDDHDDDDDDDDDDGDDEDDDDDDDDDNDDDDDCDAWLIAVVSLQSRLRSSAPSQASCTIRVFACNGSQPSSWSSAYDD